MEKVLDRKFLEAFYNPELNILEATWLNVGEEISEEEFKETVSEFAQTTLQYRVRGFISDTQRYHYVINPEVQAWHDTVIIPQYVKAGVEQIVFVLDQKNLFAALSLEQTFEEEQASSINTDFADNLENAKAFFVQNLASITF